MSLLDLALFEPLFVPFRGKRIGLVTLSGNVGDRLIDTAAEQLLADFGIRYRVLRPEELERGEPYFPLDAILVSGGGNMGSMYPRTQQQRRQALALRVPVSVMPQSFTDDQEDLEAYAGIFVRERASLRFAPTATLAPDLALGLRSPWEDEGAEAKTGVWLRADRERSVAASRSSLGDPIEISKTVEDYLGLASKFEHIVTDRLHFAIAGLLLDRRVTLLPNSYHKNRSMYETWLRDLGCRWRNSADGIKADLDGTIARLWQRFAAPPSALVAWQDHPARTAAWECVQGSEGTELRSEDGKSLRLSPTAALVWSLCDGEWSVEDMCRALAEQFEQKLPGVARDVQLILRDFRARDVIARPFDTPAVRATQDRQSAESVAPVASRSATHKPPVPCIRLEVLAPRKHGNRVRWAARVQGTRRGDFLHWFEFDSGSRDTVTRRADPFVLALLPRAMNDGYDLSVTGAPVDPLLLDHLDEYQRVWQAWRPDRLRPVAIHAVETAVHPRTDLPALAAFSGGVDSLYTVFRHCIEPDGRRNRRLGAVVMGLGLDIAVNDRKGYRAAVERLRPVTAEVGVELIEVASNIRNHVRDWEMEHGAALAAVLSLFSGRFGTGLIPATAPYRLMFPWGSNPLSDPMLGGTFEIRHDSAAVQRFEKLKALTRWPTALQRLRVCWQNHRTPAQNCGRCAKCYQLAMGLRALRAPLTCFENPPAISALETYARKGIFSNLERLDFSCILSEAGVASLLEPWVATLRERVLPDATKTAPENHDRVAPYQEVPTNEQQ